MSSRADSAKLPKDTPQDDGQIAWSDKADLIERIQKRSGYRLTPWAIGYIVNAAIIEGAVRRVDDVKQSKDSITDDEFDRGRGAGMPG